MIQVLPPSTLLRYVYNELPADELRDVEEALRHDAELAAACADLLLAQRALNGLRREPKASTTDAILQYSRTFMSGK